MRKLQATRQIQARLLILMVFITIFAGFLFPGAGGAETCEEWVAKVVSVQGSVQAQKVGKMEWIPVNLNDTYCPGDMIRVGERSRVAVILRNENILRLDQKTTITFTGLEKEQTFLLDLLTGAVHFFSRIPRTLKVITPFVNAAVEGTEFFVRVERDQTFLSIFEGRVAATNELGSLTVTSGQSAVAQEGQAPAIRIVVRPRDAVQWALYYPPVIYVPPEEAPKEDTSDPGFLAHRASLLLAVGRVDEAAKDIERALTLDPIYSDAFALQSIIAVVQNEKEKALTFAKKSVETGPNSATARIALSYAQQASFDLKGARESLEEAVKLGPENAVAWARLAELWSSFGNLKKALDAAKKAVALNPDLSRTQTVLGFAYLTKVKTKDARAAFEKAIELDQGAPLPRLGLGLAKIRQGKLKAGRGEIGIAASLDPNNSLIRSYLGKAYFEEKRDKLAKGQFAIAKELDPLDPTPWFYDAIRKQTVNRPVEALQDLQKSIELNDNRAIYRSRLLLDEDLAARSASLGRIYRDLGFQQLGLVEGWKSVNADPANYSAHRFLADTYSTLPRHEIARVSELLQSQLLQPINITPVQPQLGESDLLVLEGAGPSDPAFNEFNPLFLRNRLALQGSGVVGGDDTLGDELVHSGVWGRLSYSLGQFHYETDGFRENNDLEEDIYNVFAQFSLSHKTSLQAEFRSKDTEAGDLPLRFDPDNFTPTLRQIAEQYSIRLGFHHAFTPHSDLIGSIIYQNLDSERDVFLTSPVATVDTDVDLDEDDAYLAEVRHLFRWGRFYLTGGAGHFSSDREKETTVITTITFPFPLPPVISRTIEETDFRHTNLYLYSLINYPKSVTWTIGCSADLFEGGLLDRNQVNPKFGLTWNPFPNTTLRGAVFRVLKRRLVSNQTIEPTQVAGFNQFFDDTNATESWRYGVAIDQRFIRFLYGGVEFSWRDLKVPFETIPLGGGPTEVQKVDWEEDLARAYLYWAPHPWLGASAEYAYERFKRDPEFTGIEEFTKVATHRVTLGTSFFHPWGFRARLRATYIDQEGTFEDPATVLFRGSDRFWVVDGSIAYRLPKRWGFITIGARNLFDEEFKFQDTDPKNPTIYPDRLFFAKFTLAF